MSIVHVDERNFEAEVLQASLPVLVDFWADWCRPCHQLTSVLEELATEMESRLIFAKANVDDAPSLAERYGIMNIPTMILFVQGEEVKRIIGFKPKKRLRRELEKYL